MGTNTPHTCIPGLVWQKQARRFSQFEFKVCELRFPIHFVCVSAALYHRGGGGGGYASAIFPLRWIWPIRFWKGETPVGSSASLSGLAPPWRHALVSGSHLDPKMTGNSGFGAVRAGKRRAWAWELLFRLRLTSIGWDLSHSEQTIWDPISSFGRVMPPSDFVLDSSRTRSSFSQTKKNWPKRFLPRPSTPQTLTHMWNSFSSELPL